MKCNIYFSFSLYILIDTPHYAVFAFHFFVLGSFLYKDEIMYEFFFILVYRDFDM